MGYIKKFVEFICERQQEDLYDAQKIVLTLKDGFEQKKKWDAFKKSEFNDIAVLKKGKYGLRLDLRIDGGEEYKWNNHLPCVYFRNGDGDMDFLPMIICNKPYIPYPFVQNISDEELLWIYRFVLRNKKLLLKYANSKISSLYLFNRINENAEVSYVNEGSGKISEQDSGLSRCVWIGPYENTNHYLRLKIQTPKSSSISEEWASLSIPDLEIKKERGEYDLTGKEELAVKRFAIINKEALDDFAKDVIDFDELIQTIIKVDKKGKPILKGKDNIEYTNEKDGNLSVK